MKIQLFTVQQVSKRHIRLARNACAGLYGYERAIAITSYFESNGHPHANLTFTQMANNRKSDKQFPIDLMNEMAKLCAENEHGYKLQNVEGLWIFKKSYGNISFNHASVNQYVLKSDNEKLLITVEYDDKVNGFRTFNNHEDFESWVEELVKPFIDNTATRMRQIANVLDKHWSTQ